MRFYLPLPPTLMPQGYLEPESPTFGQDLRNFRAATGISARMVDLHSGTRRWFTSTVENSPNRKNSEKFLEGKRKIAEFIYRYNINPGQFVLTGKGGYRAHRQKRNKKVVPSIGYAQPVQQDSKILTFAKGILTSNLDAQTKVMVLNKLL